MRHKHIICQRYNNMAAPLYTNNTYLNSLEFRVGSELISRDLCSIAEFFQIIPFKVLESTVNLTDRLAKIESFDIWLLNHLNKVPFAGTMESTPFWKWRTCWTWETVQTGSASSHTCSSSTSSSEITRKADKDPCSLLQLVNHAKKKRAHYIKDT